MPPRRLDPKENDDLNDAMEERILEKLRAELKSEMALRKSDMIAEIVSALGGVPRHVGSEGNYDEAVEDFEVTGEDIIDCEERPIGIRASQFARPGSQLKLKLKHKMEVSNFPGTLNPEDLIDWIGELED